MGSYSKNSHSLTSNPLFTFPGGCDQDGNCYAVSPYDFATIYNVLPLWNSGIDGTGETIAVVGRSNIVLQDVTSFRSIFNLPPPDASHLQIILNGPDPGLAGDESEADIDVQWSGAVAKNAKIDFVVSESTETTDGVDLSALYVIDNNLAPILSESFGQCELFMGTAGNAFFQNLWQQAAAQGISVFVSTGDNGSSGCDNNQGTVPQPAEDGLAISGIASTQFNVAVGGTDFNDITNPLTFWNATNDPTTGASAKGYIPETTWNNTCTNSLFGSVAGFSANAETNCNNSQLVDFVWTVGGSGGVSSCTTSNGNTPSSCTGGYSKPIWQTGAGVPSDGKRDIPDVSLFASNGFVGNFYVICEADATNGFCNINNLAGFGGTSVATPAFAGIMALADQQMATSTGNANFRQGNPNYVLYKLAAATPTAFHDTPSGSTIAMPCSTGSFNCTTTVTGHTYGVLSGYATGTGYDLATGLGSVDANALVTNWSTVTFKASATTMIAPTPTSITHGQQVSTTITVAAVAPATGTPTGDVSLLTSSGQSIGRFTLAGGSATAATSAIPGGTQTLIAHYEGDANFGGSDSAASPSVTVTSEGSKTSVALETFSFAGNQLSGNATTAVYGSPYLLRVNVTNAAGTICAPIPVGQSGCPTGAVSLSDNSNPLDGGNFVLNTLGYTEDQLIELTGGTHNLQAQYAGDVSFNASASSDSVTITPAAVTFGAFQSEPTSATVGELTTLTATVQAISFGAEPSGTITFLSDGTPLTPEGTGFSGMSGSSNGTALLNATTSVRFPTSGTHVITTSYSGDSNYSSATSTSSFTVVVTGTGSDFVLSAPTTVSTTRGTQTSLVLNIFGDANYTGSVTFSPTSCSGLPAEMTCSFNPATITGTGPTTIFLTSTAPHVRKILQAKASHSSVGGF